MKIAILYILSLFFISTSFAYEDIEKIDTETLDLIIDFGKTYKGRSYVYGGCSSKSGFDCSGFIHYIFKMAGFILPRSSRDIYNLGSDVDLDVLKKGDLLFFKTSKSGNISHVGIVSEINDNELVMLHVSSSQGVQEINILTSEYWYTRLAGSKSIL